MPTIKINLSKNSIAEAIKKVNDYRQEIIDKSEIFVKRLAEIGIPVIDNRMAEANFRISETTESGTVIYEGADTTHNTHIDIISSDGVSRANLVVEGQEILFIEFGAGVSFNGQYGQSPHPLGEQYGYTIGSYGKGRGKQKVWGYYDDGGNLVLTHGVAYTMPVYSASIEIREEMARIAREVFGGK